MIAFKTLDAIAVPIAQPNLDTDQIIPARFLSRPRTNGLGDCLFRDLRFTKDGAEIPDFILNQPPYRAAQIVLGERNFGCGSSR
jgi:3-isopropylmalate/(R)-2-methylmalate dehydratase small subunit